MPGSRREAAPSVPARYRVRLHPDDLADVAAQAGGPEALAGRLADAALAFARAHGYHLPGRPSVALVADPAVERGVIEVDAVAAPARRPPRMRQPPPGPVPAPASARARPGHAGRRRRGAGTPPAGIPAVDARRAVARRRPPTSPCPAAGPAAVDPASRAASAATAPRPSSSVDRRRPPPARSCGSSARDGAERTIEVDGTPLTLGRATDNGLVLADPRVSRHHARLQARRGTLVFTDLGSTNGSRASTACASTSARSGMGDRLLVGDTVLVVEQLPG